MNWLRLAQYQVRVWLWSIFRAPPRIQVVTNADYDHYWDSRRGETFGAESDWQRDRARIMESFLKGKKVTSVADIGCGDGVFTKYLGQRLGALVVGYDMSERAVTAATRAGIEAHMLDLRDQNARQAIPSADVMVLFEVLEHLVESEAVLKDMVTKAHVGVFFSVPNTGFLTYRLRLLFGKFPLQWVTSPNEHLRFWTMVDMRWWLDELGYKDAVIIGYRGVPGLNSLWPNLFAEGMIVSIPRVADHAV